MLLIMSENPQYKAIMHEHFRNLGRGTSVDEAMVNEVFRTLKRRDGRFFKRAHYGNAREELDDEGARESE